MSGDTANEQTLNLAKAYLCIYSVKRPIHAYKETEMDFPSGPVAKTTHSQCRGPRFDPWSGN